MRHKELEGGNFLGSPSPTGSRLYPRPSCILVLRFLKRPLYLYNRKSHFVINLSLVVSGCHNHKNLNESNARQTPLLLPHSVTSGHPPSFLKSDFSLQKGILQVTSVNRDSQPPSPSMSPQSSPSALGSVLGQPCNHEQYVLPTRTGPHIRHT